MSILPSSLSLGSLRRTSRVSSKGLDTVRRRSYDFESHPFLLRTRPPTGQSIKGSSLIPRIQRRLSLTSSLPPLCRQLRLKIFLGRPFSSLPPTPGLYLSSVSSDNVVHSFSWGFSPWPLRNTLPYPSFHGGARGSFHDLCFTICFSLSVFHTWQADTEGHNYGTIGDSYTQRAWVSSGQE